MREVTGKRSERGTALMLGTVSLVFIIPMVGLAIDVGYLYAVKTRLQSSVDGAALAAARALNLGQTLGQQEDNAKKNAYNWFYSNFPAGNWATSNTVMTRENDVQVFPSPGNPQLANVTVTARTNVPTWFMKWLNFNSTVISSTGNASRRNAVIMVVLDRSGSMCAPGPNPCTNSGACPDMRDAAKLFVGQFAAQRDRIGLVSFSDGYYVHSAPTTSFKTILGYSDSSGSANGQIDTIGCKGGTGTAQAMSVAFNELYKTNLPGALNGILLETDGLPNTLTLNWWDSGTSTFGINSISPSNGTQRGCRDSTGQTKYEGGWDNGQYSDRRLWSPTISMNTGGAGYMPNIDAGSFGALYSTDPSQNNGFLALMMPSHTSGYQGADYIQSSGTYNANNCRFAGGGSNIDDFAWVPRTDVFGNDLRPATNPYLPVTLQNGRVRFDYSSLSTKWTNYHNGALNATDNAAYRARTNPRFLSSTSQFFIWTIGLGGQGADLPDYTLLQRMANDPRPDSFNSPQLYPACSQNSNCVTYPDQGQGFFVFSSDRTKLRQAFLQLSSQILRLSE